jgi:hypothetical protein
LAFLLAASGEFAPEDTFRNFFTPIVKWITYAHAIPGHSTFHRMAQANFNIRGWQGR